jgi:hypothetical protein
MASPDQVADYLQLQFMGLLRREADRARPGRSYRIARRGLDLLMWSTSRVFLGWLHRRATTAKNGSISSSETTNSLARLGPLPSESTWPKKHRLAELKTG